MPDMVDLTDFTEQPIIARGSLQDLDLESIGLQRYDKPGSITEGIYELWGKNGIFVYRNVKGYYSLIGKIGKQVRYYFENEDNILNTVINIDDQIGF